MPKGRGFTAFFDKQFRQELEAFARRSGIDRQEIGLEGLAALYLTILAIDESPKLSQQESVEYKQIGTEP